MHPHNTPAVENTLDEGPGAVFAKVQLQCMSKAAVLVAAPVHWKNGVTSVSSSGRQQG